MNGKEQYNMVTPEPSTAEIVESLCSVPCDVEFKEFPMDENGNTVEMIVRSRESGEERRSFWWSVGAIRSHFMDDYEEKFPEHVFPLPFDEWEDYGEYWWEFISNTTLTLSERLMRQDIEDGHGTA